MNYDKPIDEFHEAIVQNMHRLEPTIPLRNLRKLVTYAKNYSMNAKEFSIALKAEPKCLK